MSLDGKRIKAYATKLGWTIDKKGTPVGINDLRIYGFKCHATFAGDLGELIVLLSEFDN